ncbi:MAG: methyltransferase domain-containing protein [Nitrosopumilus sp.]|nr:methyltransferase domain-containing protein [Nitrosopumilus sp.]MDH3386144.1 methyltransferase domain-containing protein [Nitrosopumilus sp.]
MKEFSLDYLRCIKCNSKLELDVFKKQNEIEEGLLECKKCKSLYPIIEKIPILWEDFPNYISNRRKLGGRLVNSVSIKMKKFLKNSLRKIPNIEDRTNLEERWANIYQNSKRSRFYSKIKSELKIIPKSKLVLEYGCSIGIMSSFLAESNQFVFGVDRSFRAIKIATSKSKDNLDYFVADSLSPIFGKTKFDLILALNLLELIEPAEFLKQISSQIQNGTLIITDPYDYDRGKNSVKNPLDENTLRQNLKNLKFKITSKTSNPSNISWNLKLNPRTTLNYKVDLVVAKK